jgi:S-adenosylhomocysteine hydrolase
MMRTRNLLNLTTKGLFAKGKTSQNGSIAKPFHFAQLHRCYTTAINNSNNQQTFFLPQSREASENQYTSIPFSCELVLTEIAKQLKLEEEQPFKNVMVVAVQHILGTTVEMFQVLKRLGLERAIIAGKSYSTHDDSLVALKDLEYTIIEAPDQLGYGRYDSCMQETVSNIWSTALKAMQEKPVDLLIILDDGGDLILSTPGKLFNGITYKPKRVIGIEQTRGGSNHRYFNGVPFPIINVAGSYVKTTIEYPSIAEIVADKLSKEVHDKAEMKDLPKKPIVGVIGNGTMGQAIVNKFAAQGYRVLAYDKANTLHNKNVIWYKDAPSLISNADIIIGCTGTDITAEPINLYAILNSVKPKYLVSTSSKDIEFNSLLVYIQEQTKKLQQTPDPLKDIEYITAFDYKITILKGGFPINFDKQKHSVSPEKIWPTRAALMSACLMAVHAYNKGVLKTADVLKLDAHAQKLILRIYEDMCPHDPIVKLTKSLDDVKLVEFILAHSDGHEIEFSLGINDANDKQAPSPSMDRQN